MTQKSKTVLKGSLANRLSIEYVDPASLIFNPKNPRVHSEKQIHKLARNMATFGFVVPILVDRNGNIIAGHARVKGAIQNGMTSVPIIRLEHLSDNQCRALMIADNRLAESSTWDEKLLGENLVILSQAKLDFDLETIGFDMGEIDLFIENLDSESNSEIDPADVLPEETKHLEVSQPGDLWFLEQHRVLCGNALNTADYAALMGDQKASLVFTDPPYNVRIDGHATGNGAVHHREFVKASGELSYWQFAGFLYDALRNAASHSVNGSIHFVCMDWRHMGELLDAGNKVYGELKNLCIFAKDNAGMGSLYRSQHELIFVFKKGKDAHRNNIQLGSMGRYRSNLWKYPGVSSFGRSTSEGNLYELHPTVKPVAMVADAILDCSARNDIVLDPFLGSGRTVIAAERTGRVCYGLEIDPLYVDTIVRRWQAFTGQSAVHQQSGKSFREMEEERNAK